MNNSLSSLDLSFLDLHYHALPDLYVRKFSARKAAEQYKALSGGVCLKSHLGSTAIQSSLLQQEGFPVFPSIVLNHIAGGINHRAVIQALSEYQPTIDSKMIVHFPTITGRKHHSQLSRSLYYSNLSSNTMKAEQVSKDDGTLRSESIDIIKMSRDYPILISTGHASLNETYRLIDACEKYDVPALILNQPANPLTGFTAEMLYEVTKNSRVWVEQTALTYLLGYQDEDDFKAVLSHVPHVFYSSDLGQTTQMNIQNWYHATQSWFSAFELTTTRRKEICQINPLQLLAV